jgi:hypothetical protein
MTMIMTMIETMTIIMHVTITENMKVIVNSDVNRPGRPGQPMENGKFENFKNLSIAVTV